MNTSSTDRYAAIARTIDNVMRDVDLTIGNDNFSSNSSLNDHDNSSSPIISCSAGHSASNSFYLFAAAPHSVEGLLAFDAPGAFPLLFPPPKDVAGLDSSSNSRQHVSVLPVPHARHEKAPNIGAFRRTLEALQKRGVTLKWVNTHPTRRFEQHSAVTKCFIEWLASVSATSKLIPLEYLIMDRRVVPTRSLFQTLHGQSYITDDSCEEQSRDALVDSAPEWAEVDVGFLKNSLQGETELEVVRFHRYFRAQLSLKNSKLFSEYCHSDQIDAEMCESRPLRMVLRGFLRNPDDETLDRLCAFEEEASLLRPSNESLPSAHFHHLQWTSLFAGLMANLAMTQTSLLTDVVKIEDGHYVFLHSVLIRPITASSANVRKIQAGPRQTLRHYGEVSDDVRVDTDVDQWTNVRDNGMFEVKPAAAFFQRFLHVPSEEKAEERKEDKQRAQSILTALRDFAALSSAEILHSPVGQRLIALPDPGKNSAVNTICAAILRDETNYCSATRQGKSEDDNIHNGHPSGNSASFGCKEHLEITTHRQFHTNRALRTTEVFEQTKILAKNVTISSSREIHDSDTKPRSSPLRSPKLTLPPDMIPELNAGFSPVEGGSPNWPALPPLCAINFQDPQSHAYGPSQIQDANQMADRNTLRTKSSYSPDVPVYIKTGLASKPRNGNDQSGRERNMSNINGPHDNALATDLSTSFDVEMDGSALLETASLRFNLSVSELLETKPFDVSHQVRVCLERMSALVEVVANADYWKCIHNSFPSHIKKQSVVFSALRNMHRGSKMSKCILPKNPDPKYWAIIIDALVQVVWYIAEGANRYQTGTSRIGPKRRQNLIDRAISLLSSIQLAGETVFGTDGQIFYREVISSFFQDVLVKFLNGSHPESFIDAVRAVFIEYDVSYNLSPFPPDYDKTPCTKPNYEEIESHVAKAIDKTSSPEQQDDNRSERDSSYSQRRLKKNIHVVNHDVPRAKRTCHQARDIKEMIAVSRDKKLAVEQRKLHFSRQTLDVEKAKCLQKPLSFSLDKRGKIKKDQKHQKLPPKISRDHFTQPHLNSVVCQPPNSRFTLVSDIADEVTSLDGLVCANMELSREDNIVIPATPRNHDPELDISCLKDGFQVKVSAFHNRATPGHESSEIPQSPEFDSY